MIWVSVVYPGVLGEIHAMTAFWAALFFAACVVVIMLRLKLNATQVHTGELQRQLELSARRRRVAMDLFNTLGSAFETRISLEDLLRSIAAFFMRIAEATGGGIYMLDQKKTLLQPAAMCGALGGLLGRTPNAISDESANIPLGEGPIGEVALSGRPMIINDCSRDARLSFLGAQTLAIENAMAVPLRFRDHTLGVILVVNRLAEDGRVGKPFGRFEFQLLEAMAVYAATAVHLTLSYLEQTEKQRLDFDLGVASEIQRLLLPQHEPVLHGVSIVGHSRPAYRVGGDHYDFIDLGDSRLGVVIADVSGKGVTGALVMASCHAIVRTHAMRHAKPLDAVKEFRQLLLADIPEDRFITMIYGILDARKHEFTFVRAGHDPLLCYRADSGKVEQLSPKGGAIGLDRSEHFDRNIEQHAVELAEGDAIVLFTDGLTEATNPDGEEFGLERLSSLISQEGALSATDLVQSIYKRIDTFAKGTPAMDDQTLVILKRS